MSQENVENVKRTIEAANRRDIEAVLEEVEPEAEWPHPGFHARWVGRRPCIEGTKVSARCCETCTNFSTKSRFRSWRFVTLAIESL